MLQPCGACAGSPRLELGLRPGPLAGFVSAISDRLERAGELGVDPEIIRGVADSARCPPNFLPWLGWALKVEGWEAAYIDTQRRELIHEAIPVHKTKGTVGAIRRVAQRLGNKPQADGDGQRYRGRGLIQITGRDNYEACSEALFGDSRLLNTPDLLEQPVYASLSAGWFWQRAGLNSLADKVAQADDSVFESITRRINGGLNGLKDRQALYQRALEVLQ